jgi:murein peptide amidase A
MQHTSPSRARLAGLVPKCLLLSIAGMLLVLAGCQRKPAPDLHRPEPPTPPPTTQQIMPPQPVTSQIGSSVEGRPIVMHRFGEGPDAILIFGGIHGSEPTSVVVAERLAQYLREHPEVWEDHPIVIIPCANPDGLAQNRRTNVNQIDINRNFPASNFGPTRPGVYFGGRTPASEPETQVIISVIDQLQPTRIISIHSIRRGRHGNNYDGPARELAERMSEHNGYPVLETMGYPTPGSFGSWAGIDLQIPVITLELPRDQPGDEAWEDNREALLAAIWWAP